MLARNVLNDHLDTDVLQIGIGRRIARVIAQGKVKGVPGRLNIRVVMDETWERPAGKRSPCRRALEVHIRRRGLGMEIMRFILHEAGHAPRTAAPTKPSAITHA